MNWVSKAFSVYAALGQGLIATVITISVIIVLVSWAIFWFLLPFYVRRISKTLEVLDLRLQQALETLLFIGRHQQITNELLAKIVYGAPPPNNIKKDEPKIKSEPSGMIIVPKGSR